MVAVTNLVKAMHAKQARGREQVERMLRLGKATEKALGFFAGPQAATAATAAPHDRPVLVWLPRSQIKVLAGDEKPGADMLIELPAWLAEKNGL